MKLFKARNPRPAAVVTKQRTFTVTGDNLHMRTGNHQATQLALDEAIEILQLLQLHVVQRPARLAFLPPRGPA